MKAKIVVTLTTSLFFILLLITACNKRNTNNGNSANINDSRDQSQVDFFFSDAKDIADDASDKNTGDALTQYKTTAGCASITHDTLSNPKQIIIDFGTINCLCADGRYRRGKIIVDYTGHYRDSGSVHHIHFDNYFVNDNQLLGTKTVSNMGKNTNNQSYFNIDINGQLIKASTTDTIFWQSTRVRTWIAGESTPARLDDVYSISGNGTMTNSNGSRTATIIAPLIKALACKWIQEGTVEISPSGKPTRILDFGNGTCDNQATVTVNSVVHNITLP